MKEDRVEREGSEELWVGVPLILENFTWAQGLALFLSFKYVYVMCVACVYVCMCAYVSVYACVVCTHACTHVLCL